MHECTKPLAGSDEELNMNFECLLRIKQTSKKLTESIRNELIKEIDYLNAESLKIDKELDELINLVKNEEGYKKTLKEKIIEFDSKASGKYSIRLRQNIKSEFKEYYKFLCSIELNFKIEDPLTLVKSTSNKSISRENLESSYGRSNDKMSNEFIEISNELKTKLNITLIREDFNDNIELFKYFRKSRLTKLETVFLAVLDGANRYLNDLDVYKNYFDRLDSFFRISFTEILETKNKNKIFNPDSLSLIKSLLESSKLTELQIFKELAGIYIYDVRVSKNSRLEVFSNMNNLFDIFIFVRNDSFHILVPHKKHYQVVKHLWVQNSFFKNLQ